MKCHAILSSALYQDLSCSVKNVFDFAFYLKELSIVVWSKNDLSLQCLDDFMISEEMTWLWKSRICQHCLVWQKMVQTWSSQYKTLSISVKSM